MCIPLLSHFRYVHRNKPSTLPLITKLSSLGGEHKGRRGGGDINTLNCYTEKKKINKDFIEPPLKRVQ